MAIAILERSRGPCSAKWAYHNAQGEVVGWTLRWDKSGGKEILPVSLTADGWIVGGMPTPRPLYRLPELTVARRVYVTEGEKAADAGRALGLVTTCSAHGAQSAKQTDWSRLAGKEVVLLPDNDTAGQQYADTVARILAKLHPAPVIKYVELPDLPPKGDLYDFVATRISEGRN
ncbi:MAG: hypothetical protein LLG00_08415 [Planctomycetaceae bacterium]|nr:hypothetical protein [Planctomycetaceae bacterium]